MAAGSIEVSLLDGPTSIAVAGSVAPMRAANANAAPRVDALGYHDEPPRTDALAIHVRPLLSGGAPPWTSVTSDLGLRASTVHTAFVVSGDAASPYVVVWCDDTEVVGAWTRCSALRAP
jgi:hypothetical protein